MMLQLLLTPSIRPRPAVLSRSAAPSMNQFTEPWMNQLGRNTNSKEKWALPMAPETLGPGSIVMAEPGNFDHYFLESLVLIVQHDERGTKGVLLNHGTYATPGSKPTSRPLASLLLTRLSLALGRPWTVEDLAPGQLEQFAASKVFLGGDAGRDTMMMVHGEEMLPGAEEIGNGEHLRWKSSPLRPGCLSRPSGGLAEAGRGSGQPRGVLSR